jgi:hypothetical protein
MSSFCRRLEPRKGLPQRGVEATNSFLVQPRAHVRLPQKAAGFVDVMIVIARERLEKQIFAVTGPLAAPDFA